jgi:hypothetical protein
VSPRKERALQKLLIWVEASTSEEAIAPSCLRALAFVFPMRTVRTTAPPLPCLPGCCFVLVQFRSSVYAAPRCSALSLSSLTGPEFLVLPPLASYVRVVRDVVALPRGLFAILVGSLVMFRWGGRNFLRVWCDLLLLEGGAELSRESRITAAMVDFEISGLSRTGL